MKLLLPTLMTLGWIHRPTIRVTRTLRPQRPLAFVGGQLWLSSEVVRTPTLPQPKLRNATIADRNLLEAWEKKEFMQAVFGDRDFNDWDWAYELQRSPPWRFQLVAEAEDGVPIGFVQVIDAKEEETHYWGIDCEPNVRAIDIWIGEENYLNRGYGTQIMEMVLREFCFEDPTVEAVVIDPIATNSGAIRFYQRIGFQPIGIRYFGPDRSLVLRLNRTDYYDRRRQTESDCKEVEVLSPKNLSLRETIYSISLRNAEIADLELLKSWDQKEFVRESGDDGDEWDWAVELHRNVTWRHQLIAETTEDDTPIGMMQIIDPALEETHYWGMDCEPNLKAIDIWIGEEDYLGKGYGTQMMEAALRDYCFVDSDVIAVMVDPLVSNTAAHRFYQRLGFQPIGIRQFDSDTCLVHRLDRSNYTKSL